MKRERRLVLDGSPCDTNFYEDGPRTIQESKARGRQMCPHYSKCQRGNDEVNGFQCIMRHATEVARYSIKERHSVDVEMNDYRRMKFDQLNPPKGWVWSVDRKNFVMLTDEVDVLTNIQSFARQIVGEKEVGPTFQDVYASAITEDGAIDLREIERHEGRFGSNGGRGCDVLSGPCSCGAWH